MSGAENGSKPGQRDRLLEKYSAALVSYIQGNGEIALQHAYEVSR